ncbi:formimidoylglutamate deiminase [soil metagenome]
MALLHCAELVVDGSVLRDFRITTDAAGRIADIRGGVEAAPGDLRLTTVFPGFANAHSHAFHRLLRGTTHADGGDFWRWRESMYRVAGLLDPAVMFLVARAVFAEMLTSGYTAVGEFHYLHHRTDGSPYTPRHAMESAIATAARDVGIRLVLLDTCYLDGGIGEPLAREQLAFGDPSAAGWLGRWRDLRNRLEDGVVTVGAAIHSVRAVSPAAMAEISAGLDGEVPLHIHVSEQPQENADCLAAYGTTPTGVLERAGLLTGRLSLVHATHLTEEDRGLIGDSGATVVICPTTEADLGDGIGPALDLAGLGARLAIGSDQNAVIDPLLELRGLEAGERLSSGHRGRFSPAALAAAGTSGGYASLGLGTGVLRVGDLCDLVEIDTTTRRTMGSQPAQLPLSATAADVRRVLVGGRVVADSGTLVGAASRLPEALLAEALEAVAERRAS